MSENKRNCIGVLTGLVLAACMLFASCDCNLSVSETNSGYKISYSTVLGKALLDTVGAVSDDGSEVIFSAEEIQKVFAETGMRNVRSESVKAESLLIEAETSEKKDDFVAILFHRDEIDRYFGVITDMDDLKRRIIYSLEQTYINN